MDPRARRTIEALLTAAEQLFARRSVDDVTLDEIATAAGVAVGSVYNHFGSKAGLHAAVVQRAVDADRRFMDRAYTQDGSAVERLYAAADAYLDFYAANPDYFRTLAFPSGSTAYPAGRELADRLATSVREQNARMVAELRRGVADGSFRAIDPDDVATVLWAAWNGIISLGWRNDALGRDLDGLRELLRVATDVVAHGLLQDRPAGGGPGQVSSTLA
ncbi:TetR/AcrR family transcriptional regulator [Nocardioides sp. KC13]|uniref:TetR/AcrR family transcriptional regulator n=1 Tax=Nocardioides turkmenicus TaxID=2711220 RepID=A0A6M1R0U0_9ACTN|nr:TetR/AcrR family transcriptional regulator [Nocardioides sp. KC13]